MARDQLVIGDPFLFNWAPERIRQTENIITGPLAVIEHPPITLDFVRSRKLET